MTVRETVSVKDRGGYATVKTASRYRPVGLNQSQDASPLSFPSDVAMDPPVDPRTTARPTDRLRDFSDCTPRTRRTTGRSPISFDNCALTLSLT